MGIDLIHAPWSFPLMAVGSDGGSRRRSKRDPRGSTDVIEVEHVTKMRQLGEIAWIGRLS